MTRQEFIAKIIEIRQLITAAKGDSNLLYAVEFLTDELERMGLAAYPESASQPKEAKNVPTST